MDARQLPACRAATAIHRGSYATLVTTHRELLGWIRAAGLKPLDPLRVIYLQFGAESNLRLPAEYLVRADEDYVTELQQPVES